MVDFLTGLEGLLASVPGLVASAFVGAASFATAGTPSALGGIGRCRLCLAGAINTL